MAHHGKSAARTRATTPTADDLEGVLRRVAEWSNRATPEQLTAFVVKITRGLMEADDQALDAYRVELEQRGVAPEDQEELLQERYSRLHDDRQRKIDTLCHFLRTTHEANTRGD